MQLAEHATGFADRFKLFPSGQLAVFGHATAAITVFSHCCWHMDVPRILWMSLAVKPALVITCLVLNGVQIGLAMPCCYMSSAVAVLCPVLAVMPHHASFWC